MPEPPSAPSTLELIDPVQEGAPRTIHPIGSAPLRVGTPLAYLEDTTVMDRPETYHIVEQSAVKQSRDGKRSVQFAEGTKVPLHVAYEFGLVDETPALTVRPGDEQPATAPDDPVFGQRAEPAAPENRMESAPANRKSKQAE